VKILASGPFALSARQATCTRYWLTNLPSATPHSVCAEQAWGRQLGSSSAYLQKASANEPAAEARTREYRHCSLRINRATCPTVPWPTANKHIRRPRWGSRPHCSEIPRRGRLLTLPPPSGALRQYSIPRCLHLRGAKASTRDQGPAAGVIATSGGTRYLAPPPIALIDRNPSHDEAISLSAF